MFVSQRYMPSTYIFTIKLRLFNNYSPWANFAVCPENDFCNHEVPQNDWDFTERQPTVVFVYLIPLIAFSFNLSLGNLCVSPSCASCCTKRSHMLSGWWITNKNVMLLKEFLRESPQWVIMNNWDPRKALPCNRPHRLNYRPDRFLCRQ